jgi:phosphoribosylformimino-5-aminoimidazole carboxamide ribotide isomerase
MPLEIIPGIDVSRGEVVRLLRGELAEKTVYGGDPAATASRWEDMGAQRLHVVDIDGSHEGRPMNRGPVSEILEMVSVPVQVAGGIRDLETAAAWLELGADRIVIGTAAVRDPSFLREALETFGSSVVVALDARDREVRVSGWTEGSGLDLVETAKRLAGAGVSRFLCTDIGRDGTLQGPNVELLAEVAKAAGVPLIASGGVSSLGDIRALAAVAGIEGVVVGKALYTGDVQLTEALEAVRAEGVAPMNGAPEPARE